MENKEFNYTEEFEKSLKEFSTHGREVLVAEAHFNHMEAVRFCHDYYSLKRKVDENKKILDKNINEIIEISKKLNSATTIIEIVKDIVKLNSCVLELEDKIKKIHQEDVSK